jgi:predicted tellurium resistance membrane protein TerC
VLMFVGVKMLGSNHIHMPTWVALSVVVGVLAIAVVASVLNPKKQTI